LSRHWVTVADSLICYPREQLGNTMARLTAKTVENAKPRTTRVETPDDGCRGLYLIVQPSGRKSWAVRYRFNGKSKKLTLDRIDTLAAARKAATDALHELELGHDPAAKKFEAEASGRAATAARARDLIESLAAEFIVKHAKKRTRESTWRETERIFAKELLPVWRGRTVHDVTRRDVIDLLERIAEDRPIMANRVLAAVRKFFNWMAARDIIKASPCVGVEPPGEVKSRDRWLTDDEIKTLWLACEGEHSPFGPFVKMLLLTGQRRNEVAGMRWSELDLNGLVWTLPASRTKNGVEHVVPLSTQVFAIVSSMPRIADSKFVFTIAGDSHIGGFDRVKTRLDARMQLATSWVFHDLRRTAISGMARLGVDLAVIERTINHTSGTFAGVVGIYQRHDFAAGKRAALQRWANHIDELVHGAPTEKVVRGQFGRGGA
jgi:integrase